MSILVKCPKCGNREWLEDDDLMRPNSSIWFCDNCCAKGDRQVRMEVVDDENDDIDDETIRVVPPTMTLRDWFAGMALQGIFSLYQNYPINSHDEIAEHAYKYADAMLKARNKETE